MPSLRGILCHLLNAPTFYLLLSLPSLDDFPTLDLPTTVPSFHFWRPDAQGIPVICFIYIARKKFTVYILLVEPLLILFEKQCMLQAEYYKLNAQKIGKVFTDLFFYNE